MTSVRCPPTPTYEPPSATLGLDQPMIDPTTLTGEEILDEVQRMVKALLGYGASMPKSSTLYVKNMVFLDGAIATLAPDLDILAEITNVAMLFASRHGEQLGRDLGFDPRAVPIDLAGVKQGFGVDPSTTRLTHRDLQDAPCPHPTAHAPARMTTPVPSIAVPRHRPLLGGLRRAAVGAPSRGEASHHGESGRMRRDPQ